MSAKRDYALFLAVAAAAHIRLDIAGRFCVFMYFRDLLPDSPYTLPSTIIDRLVTAIDNAYLCKGIRPVRLCSVRLVTVIDKLAAYNKPYYMQDSVLSCIVDDAGRRRMKYANLTEAEAIEQAIALYMRLHKEPA